MKTQHIVFATTGATSSIQRLYESSISTTAGLLSQQLQLVTHSKTHTRARTCTRSCGTGLNITSRNLILVVLVLVLVMLVMSCLLYPCPRWIVVTKVGEDEGEGEGEGKGKSEGEGEGEGMCVHTRRGGKGEDRCEHVQDGLVGKAMAHVCVQGEVARVGACMQVCAGRGSGGSEDTRAGEMAPAPAAPQARHVSL